jgi:hypothetical protein
MNIMATKIENTSAAVKTVKEKKAPIALAARLTDQLKRGAMGGKISPEELDKLMTLAAALKTFMTA